MTAVIRTDAATVVRGGKAILSDLTWTVSAGERWVVLGPNGAGKSTLLDLVATTGHPSSGSVEVLGRPLGLVDVFELRPAIGVVSPQTTARIPGHEILSDVVMTAGWAVSGRFKERYDDVDVARTRELLELMGVAHLAERRFGSLSDGEKQRTLIARALYANPEVLLLDEPAAGLDLGAREDLVERLGGLALDPDAPTQVMITHHVEEIPVGYTHALLIRDGCELRQGQIDEVLSDESLSEVFGRPLSVRKVFSRFWAFAG